MATRRALITGASSGIGAAFARRLAARQHDLTLVARRRDRLETLAGELHQAHGVAVNILIADLATEEGIAVVETAIATMAQLDLLINNAGFGVPGAVAEVDPARLEAMIRVHDIATVRLCRAALPVMTARRAGALINVSSVVAFLPSPGTAVYAASKTFLNAFSRALAMEVASSGVRIQALCPGLTHSGFHDTPDYHDFSRESIPRFLWMTADAVVNAALRQLPRGGVICIPGWQNKTMVRVMNSPLAPVLTKIVARSRRRQD